MDPVTHAVVGLGVSALSGQAISPYNPLYCAAVMGAVAPDLDVVTMLKGELSFIKHHRGISHSLGGFLLISAAISGIIYLDFGGNLWQYYFWALLGTLTHGLLDFLNSYGTQLLWPFSKKRQAGNLLMFFDPFLLLLFFPVFVTYQTPQKAAVFGIVGSILYLLMRWKLRLNTEHFLKKLYDLKPKRDRLAVLPASQGNILSWDFFIEEPGKIMVGTLNNMGHKIKNFRSLDRKMSSPLIFKALETAPGRWFCQFTSFYHIIHWEEKGKYFVKLLDLRFKHQTDFFYRATLIFNEQQLLEEAYFYRYNNLIPMDIG